MQHVIAAIRSNRVDSLPLHVQLVRLLPAGEKLFTGQSVHTD